jgi:hypothetical protein
MRTNLIMHFHCAECGSVLNLREPSEEKVPNERYESGVWAGRGHDKEPTGAAVRYVEAVQVEPCRVCIDRYTGPAKRLAEAMQQLTTPPERKAANG